MPERITFPTPAAKTQTGWDIESILILPRRGYLQFRLVGDNGEVLNIEYPTPPPESKPSQPSGAVVLSVVNKSNFSVNSLIKQLFTRFTTDGYTSGTVTGTPV